ncbi:MAG TPA: PIG-L family deacetylase [Acidimicrobiales bacterium]|nr:PIG-L family deacetylase [Acidimicrobiales bacterium]
MSDLLNIDPGKVLAVFAHPDCAIVNCGGALALWASGGAEVTVVSCSRGERGGDDPDLSDEDMARRRREELSESLAILGARPPVILDYPDGELENTLELRRSVVGLIRTYRPEVLISHDPTAVFYGDRYISHPDHRAVGWAVVDSAGSPSASVRYHPDLGAPHRVPLLLLAGSLDPGVTVDIGPAVGAKAAAIRAQVSHVGPDADWVDDMVRARAEQSGESSGVALAELFRAVRAEGPAD